ncbi:MAG: hypothetical protein LUQ65_14605, partial [Candidatus Helarchaeota archaeon]|nr:hypothetical protein [Candidatus Helarchaeota archaeon]
WWTDPENGLFDPQSFNWKPIFKAKYHLINDKKDLLPWMTFSEIYSQGKQFVSQKFKQIFKKRQKKK